MCLDFVHYGFDKEKINEREIINSVCTCLNFLCPFVFTLYYFKHGGYVELVFSVQNVSREWKEKFSRISRWYTLASVCLWGLLHNILNSRGGEKGSQRIFARSDVHEIEY